MSYRPIPTTTRGGQDFVRGSDPAAQQIMERILVVLEKLNVHLSLGSDTTVDDGVKL